MPSPFPGMDPWLESPSHFPDFHNRFLNAISALLNRSLPAPFFTALSTRVYMEKTDRRVEPDVDVLIPREWAGNGSSDVGVATMPARVSEFVEVAYRPLPSDEFTEYGIEVFTNVGENKLVTSIELLSRANKTPGDTGRGLYFGKQYEMKAAGVNLVEIDLLRFGAHSTSIEADDFRAKVGPYDYHISCWRANKQSCAFGLPLRLSDRLPLIPIPLTSDVAEATIDLQLAFDRAYDEAAYDRRIKYDRPCDPPLTPEQVKWAEGILKTVHPSKGV